MKAKIVFEYKVNGYNIRLIKPDIPKEERQREDIKIVRKIKDMGQMRRAEIL
jgi:hypothetical protein